MPEAIAERDIPHAASAFGRADRALYAAKRAGRNCIIVFDEMEIAKTVDAPPDTDGGELVPTLDDQIHALRRMGKLAGM